MPKAHHEHSPRSSRSGSIDTQTPGTKVLFLVRRAGRHRTKVTAQLYPKLRCSRESSPASSCSFFAGPQGRSPPAPHRLRRESPLSPSHQTPNPVDAAKKLGLQQHTGAGIQRTEPYCASAHTRPLAENEVLSCTRTCIRTGSSKAAPSGF